MHGSVVHSWHVVYGHDLIHITIALCHIVAVTAKACRVDFSFVLNDNQIYKDFSFVVFYSRIFDTKELPFFFEHDFQIMGVFFVCLAIVVVFVFVLLHRTPLDTFLIRVFVLLVSGSMFASINVQKNVKGHAYAITDSSVLEKPLVFADYYVFIEFYVRH